MSKFSSFRFTRVGSATPRAWLDNSTRWRWHLWNLSLSIHMQRPRFPDRPNLSRNRRVSNENCDNRRSLVHKQHWQKDVMVLWSRRQEMISCNSRLEVILATHPKPVSADNVVTETLRHTRYVKSQPGVESLTCTHCDSCNEEVSLHCFGCAEHWPSEQPPCVRTHS